MANQVQKPQILSEIDNSLLTTTLEIIVLSGSQEDVQQKVGLTNLMAELMLRGTKNKSRTKFQSELERMGASLNAITTQDKIVFAGKVIRENTQDFLNYVEAFLLNPAFQEKEFKSLKEEVVAEVLHLKNQNNRLPGLALRREVFAGTSLEFPQTGTLSTLKNISLDNLARNYNDRFHRGNVLFAVASTSASFPAIEKKLTAIWSQLPDGPRRAPKSVEPKFPKTNQLIVVKKEKTSTGTLVFGQKGITASDKDRFSLALGNFAFGGEPLVCRLFRVIRGELGWTYSVGSTYFALGALTNQTGLFAISSTPSVEFTAKTILKTIHMWEEYFGQGVREAELKLGQDNFVNSYPFDFDSAEKRLDHKINEALYNVPILKPAEYEAKIRAITLTDVKKALQERQKKEGWVIVVLGDPEQIKHQLSEEQKSVPEAQQIKISKTINPDSLIH